MSDSLYRRAATRTIEDLARLALSYGQAMDERARGALEAIHTIAQHPDWGGSETYYVNIYSRPADGRGGAPEIATESVHVTARDAAEEIIQYRDAWAASGYGYAHTLTGEGVIDLEYLADALEAEGEEDAEAYQRAGTLTARQLGVA